MQGESKAVLDHTDAKEPASNCSSEHGLPCHHEAPSLSATSRTQVLGKSLLESGMVSSRPARSTWKIPGQSGLHRETLSQNKQAIKQTQGLMRIGGTMETFLVSND